jgi:hypothetical protein
MSGQLHVPFVECDRAYIAFSLLGQDLFLAAMGLCGRRLGAAAYLSLQANDEDPSNRR